ncbi:MAG: thioredoxin domain-containing protein [Pseudomonadota bacterium]
MINSRILLAAAAVILGGALGISHFVTSPPAKALHDPSNNRQEIEEIIREYLLANPEIIIESVERYSEEARAEAAAQASVAEEAATRAVKENFDALTSGDVGHSFGASREEAEVFFIEFYDYNCGYCRQATSYVEELIEAEDNVRFVMMELPIINPASRDIALASIAAADIGAFLPLHTTMMEARGLVEIGRLQNYAAAAGIDYDAINSRLKDSAKRNALEAKLEASIELARDIGVDGTPGFIIASADGEVIRIIPGMDKASIQRAIEDARQS